MTADETVEYLRRNLAGAGSIRETKMFGGTGFMLDGNMVAGTFRQGLLARVGKDAQGEALAWPGARQMEMSGRLMEGYVYIDPSALTQETVEGVLRMAVSFVRTLPAKESKPAKTKGKRT